MTKTLLHQNCLVLGLGNPLLKDDGIGIFLAERLKKENPTLIVETTSASGFHLVDHLLGYNCAIIIDSIITGKKPIGNVQIYNMKDFADYQPFSIHSTDLVSALEIWKQHKLDVPTHVYFIGIEVKDNSTFEEAFSEEIETIKENIYFQVKEKVFQIMEGIND